eukprot:14162908-Heterocapsa_arctica.AAC.1
MITDAAVVEQGPLTVISGLKGQPQAIGLAIPKEILGRGRQAAIPDLITEDGTTIPGTPAMMSGIEVLISALDVEYLQEAED